MALLILSMVGHSKLLKWRLKMSLMRMRRIDTCACNSACVRVCAWERERKIWENKGRDRKISGELLQEDPYLSPLSLSLSLSLSGGLYLSLAYLSVRLLKIFQPSPSSLLVFVNLEVSSPSLSFSLMHTHAHTHTHTHTHTHAHIHIHYQSLDPYSD